MQQSTQAVLQQTCYAATVTEVHYTTLTTALPCSASTPSSTASHSPAASHPVTLLWWQAEDGLTNDLQGQQPELLFQVHHLAGAPAG